MSRYRATPRYRATTAGTSIAPPAPRGALARFRADASGAAAVMFGLALVPLVGVAGVALDYSRATNARAHMQAAADGAALALTRKAETMSDAELVIAGRGFFAAAYAGRTGAVVPPVTVTRVGKVITVSAGATMDTTMARVLGQSSMAVGARSSANYDRRKVEVALVLDNTGSMAASGKMPALKAAAKDFLDGMQAVALNPGDVKVSLVPFDTQVKVGAEHRNAAWLDHAPYRTSPAAWTGCVADRDQPNDVRGDLGAARYPAQPCAWGGGLKPMMPLGTDFDALRARVAGMAPSGNTNLTIGLAWGLATLTQGSAAPGAVAFSDAGTDKYLILLTDGDNTQNRWGGGPSAIDARTSRACDEAKDPAKKIKVFTIRVIDGNTGLLRACASSPSMYYNANDASGILPAFQAIKNTILGVRLSS